jgi:hypothetical protein
MESEQGVMQGDFRFSSSPSRPRKTTPFRTRAVLYIVDGLFATCMCFCLSRNPSFQLSLSGTRHLEVEAELE